MKAYRVQIIKAKLSSYWYSDKGGNVYWATESINREGELVFEVIEEGEVSITTSKQILKGDCVVLKESNVHLKDIVLRKVIAND